MGEFIGLPSELSANCRAFKNCRAFESPTILNHSSALIQGQIQTYNVRTHCHIKTLKYYQGFIFLRCLWYKILYLL